MAVRNIPTDRITRDVFQAMFPRAIHDGAIDLYQVLRDCQFSARAILEAADPDSDNGASLNLGQANAVARSYVEASLQVLGLFEVYGWPQDPVIPMPDSLRHRQIEELAGLQVEVDTPARK